MQAQFQQMGAAVVPEQPPHERPAGWVPEVRKRYDPPQEDLASQAEQQQIWQHEIAAQEQHLAAQQQQKQHLQQPQRPHYNKDREGQPADERGANACQPPAVPASELAAAAAPSVSTLPTLLSRCCRSPQAAAVGLTAKLVGAFVVAYSGHFTPVQKHEAAQWVEALVAEGQLEAVKSYLEGMTKLVGVGC